MKVSDRRNDCHLSSSSFLLTSAAHGSLPEGVGSGWHFLGFIVWGTCQGFQGVPVRSPTSEPPGTLVKIQVPGPILALLSM